MRASASGARGRDQKTTLVVDGSSRPTASSRPMASAVLVVGGIIRPGRGIQSPLPGGSVEGIHPAPLPPQGIVTTSPLDQPPRQASRPSTMAEILRRSSAVSSDQFRISRPRSAGTAPLFAPPETVDVVFPGESASRSIPPLSIEQTFTILQSPGKTAVSSGIVSFLLPTCRRVQFPAGACCAAFCAAAHAWSESGTGSCTS